MDTAIDGRLHQPFELSSKWFFLAVFIIPLFVGLPGFVSSAEVGAEISAAQIYTDNLTLVEDEVAISQWVTAIVPRVHLSNTAPRFSVDLDYELQALFYANESELNEAYSRFWFNGLYDLVGDQLSLRGFARALQVNIDPEGRQVDNNLNVTGNRSDVYAWEVGPQWRRNIFGTSEIDMNFYVGRINYDSEDTQDVETQSAEFRLGTLDSINSFTYQVFYRYGNYDYEITGPVEFQQLQGEVGYFVSPSLQFVGIAGAETNIALNTGLLDEPYWGAGLRSWIGDNQLEAFYGRRFYGPSYRFSWTRTMNRSQLSLHYREIQQTAESAALEDLQGDVDAGLDPANDASLAPDTTIERPGSGRRSLTKRLRADYRWAGYKSSVRLYAFMTDQERLSAFDDPTIDPDVTTSNDDSIGSGLDFKWDFGAWTSISLLGAWTRRTFDTQDTDGGRDNNIFRLDMRVTYDIGEYNELAIRGGVQAQRGSAPEYDEAHALFRYTRYFFGRN